MQRTDREDRPAAVPLGALSQCRLLTAAESKAFDVRHSLDASRIKQLFG
jgi:hypothetical protein